MKLRCYSIFLAVAVAASYAVGGRAEDAPTKPAEEAPATRPNRAPLDFGFPRPEREFPGFRFRGEEGTRGTIRLPEGVSLMSTAPTAGRLITVEVILAETPASGSGKEMSAERIAELEKGGQLVSQSRYWVSLVENQRSELQFAERVPVVLGRMNIGGGRGVQESVTYENVGTKLRLLGRLEGDSVLVQLELDQTRLIPAPAKAEGEGAENANRHRTATTTFQSTLTIPPGKTVVAGGRETPGDHGRTQTWLLVSARAEERRDASPDSPIKIFRLIDANAVSLAAMLRGIFDGENVQIGVDERTNSVIARGDEKTLRVIQGILAGLDERDLKKSEAKK